MNKEVTIIFTNPTSHTIRLESIGLPDVGPGEDVEVPIHLCAAKRADSGNRGKSPIESVAPQLHPKSEDDRKLWMQTPPLTQGESKIVTVSARPAGEAPGVAALRAQVEAKRAADAAKKASSSPEAK